MTIYIKTQKARDAHYWFTSETSCLYNARLIMHDDEYRQIMNNISLRLFRCNNCGSYYNHRKHNETVNGLNLCPFCYERIEMCYECDRQYIGDYCNHCHFRCESCGDVCSNDEESSQDRVCQSCYDNYSCSICGEYCYNEDDLSEHIDRYHDNTNVNIHDYNYKPHANFLRGLDEKRINHMRYFGCEIELEYSNNSKTGLNCLADIADDTCYLKTDGSLNHGVEIVTHPATLKYWKQGFLRDELKSLDDYGYKSHDTGTCGLHVHVSKNSASESTWVKVALFWYHHDSFIKAICRRGNNGFCEKKDVKLDDPREKVINSYTRYESINFRNDHTVEFRQPKGTLNWSTLLATISIIDLLIKFASKQKPETMIDPDTVNLFKDYVKKHDKTTYNYIISRTGGK